jgi:hypothetical protein
MRGMSQDYTTTVLTSSGDLFGASFFISRVVEGAHEQVVHMEQLEAMFEFDEDARAAANRAAQAFVDKHEAAVHEAQLEDQVSSTA